MKKCGILVAVVLIIAMLLCACGAKSIVGSWTMTEDGVGITMTFNEDGTGEMSAMGGMLSAGYTYTVADGVLKLTPAEGVSDDIFFSEATYKIKGDTLYIDDGEDLLEFIKD